MAIKVVINYPQTEEAMQQLKESQARAVLNVLQSMLSPKDLAKLMQKLENER